MGWFTREPRIPCASRVWVTVGERGGEAMVCGVELMVTVRVEEVMAVERGTDFF